MNFPKKSISHGFFLTFLSLFWTDQQVKLPLCQIDLAQTISEWKDVQSNKEDDQYLGDVCFSLRYVPTSGKLTVGILECKRLKKMDITGASGNNAKKMWLLCVWEGRNIFLLPFLPIISNWRFYWHGLICIKIFIQALFFLHFKQNCVLSRQ